jgi:hypothetical protein
LREQQQQQQQQRLRNGFFFLAIKGEISAAFSNEFHEGC